MPTDPQAQLVVFGCGSQALYVIDALSASGALPPVGMVDLEGRGMVGKVVAGVAVRWSLDDAIRQFGRADHAALVAHGNNRLKLEVAKKLEELGIGFGSARHPRAGVSPLAQLGSGCILCPGCEILPGADVEGHVIIHAGAVVDHDCRIGRGANIAPGASLAGRVTVGEGAYIYTGAVIAPKVTIGAWATIGAGAIVRHDVPEGAVVVGNPARVLRQSKRHD